MFITSHFWITAAFFYHLFLPSKSLNHVARLECLLFIFYCRLPITFANSLDPDQARQNVGPDLDPICVTQIMQMVFLREFFEKVDFEEKSAVTKSVKNPRGQRCR